MKPQDKQLKAIKPGRRNEAKKENKSHAIPFGGVTEVGRVYNLNHEFFGSAQVEIVSIQGEWVEVAILEGELVGLNNAWKKGEQKLLRKEHCIFTAI